MARGSRVGIDISMAWWYTPNSWIKTGVEDIDEHDTALAHGKGHSPIRWQVGSPMTGQYTLRFACSPLQTLSPSYTLGHWDSLAITHPIDRLPPPAKTHD